MVPTILHIRWMTETKIGRSQRRWLDRHASRTFPRIILDSIYSLSTHFVVQPLSCIRLLATPWTAARQAPPSFTVSQSLLKFMSTESVIPPNHLILCCPLLLLSSIFPSYKVFSNELLFASGGQIIGASASASALPMNIQGWFPLGLTGLISLQSKRLSRVFFSNIILKASILQGSAFLMVQLSHPYMTTNHSFD